MGDKTACPRCGEMALPEEFRMVAGQCMACTRRDQLEDVYRRRNPNMVDADVLRMARDVRRRILKDDD